jgi:ABC-type multidrug transport system fused ATPase/permease subunit
MEEEVKEKKEVGLKRILGYYRPISMTIIGLFFSITLAFGWPVYGLICAKLLFIMMQSRLPTFLADRNFWMGMFLLFVILNGLIIFLQKWIFSTAGENLTNDVRNLLYRALMHKHVAWFDRKDRAPGVLSNIISEDISVLNGMTTEHLAILVEAYGGVIIGAIISLFYTWKLGLVTIAFTPFIILGGIMMSRLAWKTKVTKASEGETKNKMDDPYQMSNALLSDILINYRTVIGFGDKNIDYLLEKFDLLLEEPKMSGIK